MNSPGPLEPAAQLPEGWLSPGAPPLEVDFGCHRGGFLAAMAERFPATPFLGIEKQSARVDSCNKRLARRGLTNALAIRGDGPQSLRELLPAASVSTLHVSFPDPWPKRRHARRRLVNADFLAEAARVLRPGGQLRLMTDDKKYFDAIVSLSAQGWERTGWDDGVERPTTNFEQTFLKLGKPAFRIALRPVR